MTNITLETDRLIVGIEMLAIMTAETARRIDMTQIIWVRCEIYFLFKEYGAIKNILEGLNGRSDLVNMAVIVIRVI